MNETNHPPKTYHFDGADAARYGLPAAVLLYNIRHWIEKNEANGKHYHDGRWWTYNSKPAFAALYPFLTENQVRRALETLVAEGALVVGNYNGNSYDRTAWYALGNGAKCTGQKSQMHRANLPDGPGKKARPIPYKKPSTKPKAAAPPVGGAGCGFGLEAENATTDFDTSIATKLRAAVAKLPNTTTALSRSKHTFLKTWPPYIRALRTVDGYTEQQITTGLLWYAANVGEAFVPQAYSAKGFRAKFPAILRAAGQGAAAAVPGAEALAIFDKLKTYGWPEQAKRALPGALQVCLDRYGEWRARARAFAEKVLADDLGRDYGKQLRHHQRIAARVLEFPSKTRFAETWFLGIHTKVKNWDAWGGEFGKMQFNPTGKAFAAMVGRVWLAGWGGEAAWDKYVDFMNGEEN